MDAAAWNARYDTPELIWKGEPNQFLPPAVAGLAPGRALDLACGEGRNAVWLAAQGWEVTGVDFADVGLAKARSLAADHRRVPDLDHRRRHHVGAAAHRFDLVVVFYLQLPADEPARAVRTAVAGRWPPAARSCSWATTC